MRVLKLFGLGVALVILALAAGNGGQKGLSQEELPPTLDDIFAMWNQIIWGFGGLFFDESGNLNVYLVDLEKADYAREFLRRALPEQLGIEIPGEIVFLQGQYNFIELKEWKDRAIDVLTLDGVMALDIDDMRNRLLVAVEDSHVIHEVEHMLYRLDIPHEAVIVEVWPPFRKKKTLQDRVRPTGGGLQIENDVHEICTLSFNVDIDGVPHFVTASHCTYEEGEVHGTMFYQPSYPDSVGVEVKDPAFWEGGTCPKGRRCRYSDSALIRYNVGFSWGLEVGRGIFDPWPCEQCAQGSINIDITRRLTIVWKLEPVAGLFLLKLGRTTGCTGFRVAHACLDRNATTNHGIPITYLCQFDIVGACNCDGDSGSPVYKPLVELPNRVALYGILWGGSLEGCDGLTDSCGCFYFDASPISGIERDLGSLDIR